MVHFPERSVHPRVRGEHDTTVEKSTVAAGSSPRPRGTQHWSCQPLKSSRFIPASAGNTAVCPRWDRPPPVHPRVRGEHFSSSEQGSSSGGSSPRPRGTRTEPTQFHPRGRFIPASARNTSSRTTSHRRATVHPRVRGEHRLHLLDVSAEGGSSPRPRGTPHLLRGRPGRARFIPASAGNTTYTPSVAPARAVHPRVRGEHETES